MKKIIIPLMLILLLTGCSGEKKEVKPLDLGLVEKELAGIAYSVDEQNKSIDLIFKDNMIVTDEYMESVYNINFDNIDEFLISLPAENKYAEMYAIVLPKAGKKRAVENNFDEFIKKYQEEFKDTDKYEMTKEVFTQNYGNYLIYIVSNKSETVYNTITGN